MAMADVKPKSIDEYLEGVGDEQRAALEKLRQQIRRILPKAEEYITYGIAAFRLDGKPVVGFGVAGKNCSFYPMSGSTVASLGDELKGFKSSKAAIQFSPGKPLPVSLVKKVIQLRLEENAELVAQRKVASAAKAGKKPSSKTKTRRGDS